MNVAMRRAAYLGRSSAMVGLLALSMLTAWSVVQPVRAAESKALPALELLQKMQRAARTLDYSGVYTYQHGNSVMSTRIVHVVDGTGERERISLLDGQPREYLRHNDTALCLLPEHKLVLKEKRDSERFPAVLFDEGDRLPAHYEIALGSAVERVAGRSCRILTLEPKDSLRYGYRFCADTETGLPLRAQTVAPEGVLIQIVFNTLEVGSKVAPEALAPSWNTQEWREVEVSVEDVDLAAEGWRIPLPPGYQALKQVARQMRADRRVKQLVASDGLATISVFIEAYAESGNQPRESGPMRKGAVNFYRKRIGDHWLTVLGEVPADTVRDLAHRTEYVPLAVP